MFKSEFRSISHNAKYVKAARWRQGGGKVPLPGAYANAPSGGVRLLVQASLGWSPRPFTRRISKTTPSFTRRTTSAVSAANECEGITCGSK